jgi:hypothetical protein
MLRVRSDTLGLLITTVPETSILISVGETVVCMTYWVIIVLDTTQVRESMLDTLRVRVPVPRAQTETM